LQGREFEASGFDPFDELGQRQLVRSDGFAFIQVLLGDLVRAEGQEAVDAIGLQGRIHRSAAEQVPLFAGMAGFLSSSRLMAAIGSSPSSTTPAGIPWICRRHGGIDHQHDIELSRERDHSTQSGYSKIVQGERSRPPGNSTLSLRRRSHGSAKVYRDASTFALVMAYRPEPR
jgi:hypothetical protein